MTRRLFVENEAGQHIVYRQVEGPITLKDAAAVGKDIDTFKRALKGLDPDGAFVCAVTPGQMLLNLPNAYYPSIEAYLEAAACALRQEYRAIVDAGFNLQLDSPDLAAGGHLVTKAEPLDLGKYIPVAIEALNEATRDLPPEKLRLHVCWGNYPGPHHRDVELRKIIEPILRTRASFISFEAANPRHDHEWEIWKEVRLPDDKVIIPGVVDTLTNHVEHPRLIAQRLTRFAKVVGRERVIAGTDCGFGTYVGYSAVDPQVAWLKLQALVEGTQLASEMLW